LLQSWDSFFRNSSAGAAPGQAYQSPPSLAAPGRNQVPVTSIAPYLGGSAAPALGGQINEKVIDDHLAVQAIIRSYQVLFFTAMFFTECFVVLNVFVLIIIITNHSINYYGLKVLFQCWYEVSFFVLLS
jgi:hypothetical protein